MEDKNLVNKPVKVKQIIEALRCVESAGLAGHCYCETCPFAEKVKLSNLAFVERCNFDGILKAAADRLSNDQRHITALQKEIERLRDGRRWVPAEERLPEQMEWVLCACIDGRIRVLRYDHITDDYDFAVVDGHGYCISAASVTHWMPLPELPEEEK